MARTTKAASEMRPAVEEMMVPIAEGMRKTMEQMMATMAEEMRKLLVATIRDVMGSLLPELVITLTHSVDSILKSNSERLQTMETDISSDAEEQQRRRSAVFIGAPESRDLPHLRHERDAESVAEILDEVNVDGVPVDVYRMGVFNPTKRRPIKVVFNNTHNAVQVFRQCYMLKRSPQFSSVYIRPSYSAAIHNELFTKRREGPHGLYVVRNNLVVRRGSAILSTANMPCIIVGDFNACSNENGVVHLSRGIHSPVRCTAIG
ncbi:hypothetical protein Tcan_08313 [Toxocara canis]|uniref:Endonuclease/exonuclease/phosphatase domain-containing protein n=1 Tax=Toxocara canis TaxID=6265 RepID=A0A0B2VU56_TOXCA|nr:hypothetical protein Tcan_08313 [Toxocara canis]